MSYIIKKLDFCQIVFLSQCTLSPSFFLVQQEARQFRVNTSLEIWQRGRRRRKSKLNNIGWAAVLDLNCSGQREK